ncbi:MAG: hypothetical protein IJZ00_07665 [Lachnospiraceae bacterium]|nr:hypothetical protein [Lachnospiraceae bacterium]
MKENRKKMQNARQFKPENIMKYGKANRGFALVLIAVLIIATMCMGGCNSGTNDDEVTVSSETEEADVTNVAEEPVESEPIDQEPALNEPEVTDEPEDTEEHERLSMLEPNTSVGTFIEYINTFDITETVIIYDDADGAKFMIYSGDSCEIGYHVPRFYVYSPEKEVVGGYVTGENGEELEGEFSWDRGVFYFYVMGYYDGDVYINVEYSDGTTEELTVHFVDVYNQ